MDKKGGAGTAIAILIALIAIAALVLIFLGYINTTDTYSMTGSGQIKKETTWGYTPEREERHCIDGGPFGTYCD